MIKLYVTEFREPQHGDNDNSSAPTDAARPVDNEIKCIVCQVVGLKTHPSFADSLRPNDASLAVQTNTATVCSKDGIGRRREIYAGSCLEHKVSGISMLNICTTCSFMGEPTAGSCRADGVDVSMRLVLLRVLTDINP